ncbi:MAG: hypothetical protein Kow0047_21530 [Anaerolineae bacterium]
MTIPRALRARKTATAIVILLTILYAGWFSFAAVRRHETLNSRGYDLGNVDQAVWNTAHGRLLEFTNWIGKSDDIQTPSRLAMHFEPVYLLLAPLYWIWSDIRILLIVQAVVVAVGTLGVYWLAREIVGHPWAAAGLATCYLLSPPLQWALLDDFHAVTLVAGLAPFAFLAARRRRWGWFAVLAVLIMATKEDMPLLVGALGLYLFLWERERLAGAATILAAGIWFVVAVFVIIPPHTVEGQSQYLSRYEEVLGPSGLTLSSAPRLAVAMLISLIQMDTVRYLVGLLWPFAFLPLLGGQALLMALPSIALNVLSNNPTQHVLGRHYVAPIMPWLPIAGALGLATLKRWLARWRPRAAEIGTAIAVVAMLGTSGWAQWDDGFTPLSPENELPPVTPHHRLLDRFLAQIPPDASVSAQQNLNPHVTQRRMVTIIPYDLSGEYLFLDVTTYPGYNYANIHAWLRDNVVYREGYGIVDAADGYVLLKRGAPHRPLPDEFFSFLRVDSATPQYPMQVDFTAPGLDTPSLRFLGFDLLPRRAGEPFYALYFQALRPINEDLAVTLYLADEQYQLRGATEIPQAALVWYPTSQWQPGETLRIVADTFTWWSGELSEFAVGLAVLEPDEGGQVDAWDPSRRLRPTIVDTPLAPRLIGEGTVVHLMSYRQGDERPSPQPEWRDRFPRSPQRDVGLRVGDVAVLEGYRVETPVARPGDEVRIDLYWRGISDHAEPYTVFAHLLDEGGVLRGQQDNPPVFGTQPFSVWRTGDHVRDPYRILLPADAPPGRYKLAVGLYDPNTGERLPVTAVDGQARGDHILLEGVVRVR